ncbi:sorbosone dehydrogenase family protein [Mucilaginibacter gynuensis]|uniref:Sorbosone dehydrogenase family protein n=2 Tax=Mucilaginibacter gynuensis TaxID=1302236 RepID=A0ABP8GD88_9SPHI
MLTLIGLVQFESYAQKGLPAETPTTVSVSTFYPKHEDFKESLLSRIKVPAGFKAGVAATGLGKPRMMAISDDGGIYVTRRDVGDILLLVDNDGDGRFEKLTTVWAKFLGVHGITIKDGWLYACNSTDLKRAKINSDGSLSDTSTLIKDLPEGAQHDNRVIHFGQDGMLYMTVGSSCNDCGETNAEHATLLQIKPDGSSRQIFARGLRNTIGFDWQPQTKEIWGCDNGTDWRSDDKPREELNRIVKDGDYGWPRVYEKQQVDETREEPLGTTKAAYAKTTIPSVMEFPAHSAPIDFRFLTMATSFPKDYQDDALVCWHGSWNRKNPEGYKVQRIKFENGQPVGVEDFFSGFLSPDGQTRFGRPAGLAISNKGVLYISDDESGVIYSVNSSK